MQLIALIGQHFCDHVVTFLLNMIKIKKHMLKFINNLDYQK